MVFTHGTVLNFISLYIFITITNKIFDNNFLRYGKTFNVNVFLRFSAKKKKKPLAKECKNEFNKI